MISFQDQNGRIKVPQIPPRQQPQQRARMAERPGRDPQRPYIDNHASLASLAKRIRAALDLSHPTATVNTHELAELLEHVIAVGFGPQASAQLSNERAAFLSTARQAAEEAVLGQLKAVEDDGDGR